MGEERTLESSGCMRTRTLMLCKERLMDVEDVDEHGHVGGDVGVMAW